jgi:nicotinate-nucleotide adenylyltransferase
MRIGLFGGTFNPIHLGHLLLAETARETLQLDRVVFIPTRQPPHKTARGLLPGPQRLEMVQLAIKNHPAFVASDIELQRPGASYTIDTVRALRAQLPLQAKLFLLVGQDLLGVKWAAWEEIQRLCTLAAARRPQAPKPKKQTGIKWLDMPQLDIASSDIRKRAAAGRSIRYLVPGVVARYIEAHQLYRRAA